MPRDRRAVEAEPPPGRLQPPAGPGSGTGSDDGVDDTLIHWMLSLTPTERLQWAQDMADTVEALREGREP